MVVFKYVIENRLGSQRVDMPPSAKIFWVQISRSNSTRIYLWAMVEQERIEMLKPGEVPPPTWGARKARTFSVEMTGIDKPWIKPENYVGTYDDEQHNTLHIFEVP